jgi:hypothetical protein
MFVMKRPKEFKRAAGEELATRRKRQAEEGSLAMMEYRAAPPAQVLIDSSAVKAHPLRIRR